MTNPYSAVTHNREHAIHEGGYNEALLDVFDYLTGNPNLLDSSNFGRVQKMMTDAKQDIPELVEA